MLYLVISGGFIGLTMLDHLNQNKSTWELQTTSNIETQEYLLATALRNSYDALALLKNSKEMMVLLDLEEGDPHYLEKLTGLEMLFSNYSHQYLQFTQIRFINETGSEKLRIDNNGTEESVYKVTNLQNKSNRYYFQDCMLLQDGEIYSSPLDLNKEFGEIEVPFLPVLRIGMPLFNDGNVQKGIVIININFRFIFEIVQQYLPNSGIFFTDIDGYFFTNPLEPNNIWGQLENLNESTWNIENQFPTFFIQLQNANLEMEKPVMFTDSSKSTNFMFKIINLHVNGTGLYWILFGVSDLQTFFSMDESSLLLEYIIFLSTWTVTSALVFFLLKKRDQAYRDQLVAEKQVKKLKDILPMCANCKKIRDAAGKWHNVDDYLHTNTETDISHSICPDCELKLYGDFSDT